MLADKMENITLGQCADLISANLKNFLPATHNYSDAEYAYKTPAQRFGIYDAPPSLNNMIARLVEFYEKRLDVFAAAELLMIAENCDAGIFLDKPDEEFTGEIDKEFSRKATGYYSINALVQFNKMLPTLQYEGVAVVGIEKILQLQQAIEHASSVYTHVSMLHNFANYLPPEKIKQQASNGGKARADKLYGRTKEFAARRFSEIRSRNSTMSLSQIAVKISAELEENPIPGDEPLTNAYDTIYRWVRILNKR